MKTRELLVTIPAAGTASRINFPGRGITVAEVPAVRSLEQAPILVMGDAGTGRRRRVIGGMRWSDPFQYLSLIGTEQTAGRSMRLVISDEPVGDNLGTIAAELAIRAESALVSQSVNFAAWTPEFIPFTLREQYDALVLTVTGAGILWLSARILDGALSAWPASGSQVQLGGYAGMHWKTTEIVIPAPVAPSDRGVTLAVYADRALAGCSVSVVGIRGVNPPRRTVIQPDRSAILPAYEVLNAAPATYYANVYIPPAIDARRARLVAWSASNDPKTWANLDTVRLDIVDAGNLADPATSTNETVAQIALSGQMCQVALGDILENRRFLQTNLVRTVAAADESHISFALVVGGI